jgi:hypothetical protein
MSMSEDAQRASEHRHLTPAVERVIEWHRRRLESARRIEADEAAQSPIDPPLQGVSDSGERSAGVA